MTSRKLAPFLALLIALLLVPAAHAQVPAGATWSEDTITTPDGTQLHVDILRPSRLAKTAKTPVILSIGSYFNHAGQTGPVDAEYDPTGPPDGPSTRFYDLVNGGKLMQKGYTFVMVDLRGFGGSTGCLDWGGPGEQMDVRTAVEWAATRSWSTGRVGMYGKSYDALTGLMGAAMRPKGLKAVVAQEPVYDLYRYLYSNGVRYANSLGTPALYDLIAGTPGPLAGDPNYTVNSVNDLQRPGCPALNWADQQEEDHDAEYWRQRNFIDRVKGSKVPVFMTQGFLEDNTKPDGFVETFDNLAGPKRAWYGMWDHVRGNDVDDEGRLLMGRKGWFDEVMRWYDHFLKDAPAPTDPPVVVQTNDGTYRSEQAWPPADARRFRSQVNPGTYTDDTQNEGTGSNAGDGIWTVSRPLAHEAHLAGIPKMAIDILTQGPRANLTANVYDITETGVATLVSRGTHRVDESGRVDLDLLGNDWKFGKGHRVGVLLSSSNSEWWAHVPTMQTVEVTKATVSLPFLGCRRHQQGIQGTSSVKLEEYKEEAPFTVEAATIKEAERSGFALPPRLTENCGAATKGASGTPAGTRSKGKAVRFRVVRRGGRYVVTGRTMSGRRLGITVRRARGKVLVSRRATVRRGRFRTTFAVRRRGRYTVTVKSVGGTPRLFGTRTLRLKGS